MGVPVTQKSGRENRPIWRSKYFKSDLLRAWWWQSFAFVTCRWLVEFVIFRRLLVFVVLRRLAEFVTYRWLRSVSAAHPRVSIGVEFVTFAFVTYRSLVELVMFRWLIEFVVLRWLVEFVTYRDDSMSSWHLCSWHIDDSLRAWQIQMGLWYIDHGSSVKVKNSFVRQLSNI